MQLPTLHQSQDEFLRCLRGSGKGKYKRYNGLPLRYAGGRSLAVDHVTEQMPKETKAIMSPFFGAVEIACARELGIEVQGYDIFDLLMNFWRVVLEDPARLANKLSQLAPNKEEYTAIKKRLKAHWKGKKRINDTLDLATHYWFNHNLSYGPGFLGWMSRIYACEERYLRLVDKVRDFRCPNLTVVAGGFEKTISRHNGTVLYCDPPYYLNDGKMFRGIYPQRNFPIHHNGFDHLLLNRLLKRHKGGFILSYNDCQTIRDLYSDCQIVKVAWQHTHHSYFLHCT